ncbi:hypothetical protein ACHAQA_009103 [Verticillium albo-atrum]
MDSVLPGLEACPGAFPEDASFTSAVTPTISSISSKSSAASATSSCYSDAVEDRPGKKLDHELERILVGASPEPSVRSPLANVHRLQDAADLLFESADRLLDTKDSKKINSRLNRLFIKAEMEESSRLVRWTEKLCTHERETRKTAEWKARALSVRMGWRHHAHVYRVMAESFERLSWKVAEGLEQLMAEGRNESRKQGAGGGFIPDLWRRRPLRPARSTNPGTRKAEDDLLNNVVGRACLMRWGAETRYKELRDNLRAGHAKLMESGKRCDWIASQLFMVEGGKNRQEVRERLFSAAFMIRKSKTMIVEDILANAQFQSIAKQYGVC